MTMLKVRELVIPITLLGSILAITAIGAWTARDWKAALDANTKAVDRLNARLDETLTIADWQHILDTLKALNPDLKIPPFPRRG